MYEVVNGSPFHGLIMLVEEIGGEHAKGWVGSLKVRLPLSDLDPERLPTLSRVEKGRQTRPLEQRRKTRSMGQPQGRSPWTKS